MALVKLEKTLAPVFSPAGRPLRIAQIAPLYESVPPKLYGGTERIVAYLVEELARRGHQVTLFAAGDSTVNVSLWGCRIEGNGSWDIFAVGARSIPESVGAPGVNNHVTIEIHGKRLYTAEPSVFLADTIPGDPSLNNSATVIRQ